MEKNKLRQVIIDQQALFHKKEVLIDRDLNLEYYFKGNEIIVISGIRRCGKSSLLKLISQKIEGTKVFVNFDDIRLVDFNLDNFQEIQDIVFELFGDNKNVTYFLDEVQNITFWEKWVNNLYSQGIKVFVTGSNSNLLSSEISTHLTGRNKVIKLFPFSFREYLRLKKIKYLKPEHLTSSQKTKIYTSFLEYFNIGGFPLILKNNDIELSRQYFEDILNKDILNRYKVREVKELKDLILFLFSNIGGIYSYSTLKKVCGIKSLSTIKNYVDYFQNVFLVYQVGRFDYSIAKQKVSSSKIYVNDNSFLKTVSFNFSENTGKRLENLVFLQLKRRYDEIYYHMDKNECDFVIKENLKITQAIQVSQKLDNPVTKEREIAGLMDAIKKYDLKEGYILTLEDDEIMELDGKKIIIKSIWKWMLGFDNSK
ncbi:MAG: ATP-binding protein [Methanosarcinales archaeon]|nr:ATP-binding protein [Methanosarcinales archaeon]